MGCVYQKNCGGCCLRQYSLEEYREQKVQKVQAILKSRIPDLDQVWQEPVFLPDGTRRRAAFAFEYVKGKLLFGFNENKSSVIVNLQKCLALCEKINQNLENIRAFLERLCAIRKSVRKGKKIIESRFLKGDILVLEADNGLDIVLEVDAPLELEHRFEISDFVNRHEDIIRVCFRRKNCQDAEPVAQKAKPVLDISGCEVCVAPGMFLQASKAAEIALTDLVKKYLNGVQGHAADLFCGIGTFTYPMVKDLKLAVTAVDNNKSLLKSFKESVHKQMLPNVKIVEKNLFKYPLVAAELEKFDAVVFDPPRAGASALVKELAAVETSKRPKKIVAVSCQPQTFATDAEILIKAGYILKSVTMVDQFVYSNHAELVALFLSSDKEKIDD